MLSVAVWVWVLLLTKPNKGNGVVILDWKLYDNAIQEITSTHLNLKSSRKTHPWHVKLHNSVFYVSQNKKTFLTKMNMINCILVLLLLISMVLSMHKFFSSNTFSKLHLIVSSIGTFNYDLVCFLCDLLSTVVPDVFCFWN